MPLGLTGYIYDIDDDLTLSGESLDDPLVSFKIEENCYVDNTFIGNTVTKKITIQLNNIDNEINLENKKVKAFAGVDNEYVPFGTFTIQKPDNKEVQQTTQVIGYDYMSKFDVGYEDSNTYPITLQEFFENLCTQVGLEAGSLNIINGNYEVQGNPFTNNETCRTVLSSIAQLAGGFAKIGRDDKVYIVNLQDMPTDTTELQKIDVLDGNNYEDDFSKNNQYGEINSVVIALDDDVEGEINYCRDNESIEENGLTEIVISGNYFLINEEERLKVIDNIWNVLKGKYYLPFSVTYYGYPWLDAGDNIIVADTNDTEYNSYVLNHSFTYNGSFSGTLETEALTEEQQQYVNTNDITNVFRKVELSVDKINGQITQIIEENSEYDNKLTQITQTVNGLNEQISSISYYSREVTSTHQIHLEDCAEGSAGYIVDFIIYGDKEFFTTNEITINAGTQPWGYGENTTIDTEDGQPLTTEDGVEFLVGARGYTLDYRELVLDGILNNLTINDVTYYDTLEIAQDGTITQTRKIGDHYITSTTNIYKAPTNVSLTTEDGEDLLTEDGEIILNDYDGEYEVIGTITEGTYVFVYEILGDRARIGDDKWVLPSYLADGYGLLNEAVVTVLDETFALPSREEVFYFIEELSGLRYYAKYIIKNDYTDLFATKVELNTTVTETAEKFEVEVSRKVNEDELCSKISASPDQIILQGNRLIIDSTNFKLDENGDVTLVGQIEDDDGNILVSKGGVLTNLQFQGFVNDDGDSGGGKNLLGYYFTGGSGYALEYFTIQAYIPENFQVISAYISITHTPVHFTATGVSVTGSSHCVQAYVTSSSNIKDYIYASDMGFGMSKVIGTNTKAFGENGTTFGTSKVEFKTSEDVSKYLESGNITTFIIACPDVDSTYDGTYIKFSIDLGDEGKVIFDDEYDVCEYTGDAVITLNVYGYMSYTS